MDIETLVEEIMEAYESEPETDFGNPSINQSIRQQGIKAHIWDLLQDYTDDLTKILVPEGD
jgi:ribosomal protein S17E